MVRSHDPTRKSVSIRAHEAAQHERRYGSVNAHLFPRDYDSMEAKKGPPQEAVSSISFYLPGAANDCDPNSTQNALSATVRKPAFYQRRAHARL